MVNGFGIMGLHMFCEIVSWSKILYEKASVKAEIIGNYG